MSSAAAPPPAGDPPLRPAVRVRTLVVAALVTLAVVGLVFLLYAVLDIVLVFLIAIVVAEGIRPLVRRLEGWRVPKAAAILIVYAVILGVLTVLVILFVQPLVTQAQDLANNFPKYEKQVENFINNIEKQLHISGSNVACPS